MFDILAVFIGGGIGATLRYLTTIFSQKVLGYSIFGTLCANIIGCFLIGLIFGLSFQKENVIPAHLKLFLTVGFLGGLTTFSTFSLEAFSLFKDGKTLQSALYIIMSLVFGLSATAIGYFISKQIKL